MRPPWSSNGDGDLERPASYSVLHPLWNLVEGQWWSGDAQQGCNRADSSLRRMHESSHVQGYPGRKLAMFPEDLLFQRDNAPWHTSRSIKVCKKDNQIKTLSASTSPDLNLIENGWCQATRHNWAELLFLAPVWHEVTQERCERVVESMSGRVKAVIENQVYWYWFLNSS